MIVLHNVFSISRNFDENTFFDNNSGPIMWQPLPGRSAELQQTQRPREMRGRAYKFSDRDFGPIFNLDRDFLDIAHIQQMSF